MVVGVGDSQLTHGAVGTVGGTVDNVTVVAGVEGVVIACWPPTAFIQ